MTSAQLSAVFFLQVFFILAVCRCVGILARRVGQPQVVGEMIAGVIMGPSLFGLLFPSWQQLIFPKDSLKILYVLQKGIIQPALFSIMVIMAIVTTLMASPVFELVYRKKATTVTDPDAAPANGLGWATVAHKLCLSSSTSLS
jgi:Kef-type K+ transport system membrane component KefB